MGIFDDLLPQNGSVSGLFDDLLPPSAAPATSLRPPVRAVDAPAVADEGPVQPVTGEPEHAPFAASRPGAAPVRRGFGTPAAPDGEDAPEAGAPAEPPPAAADPFDSALIAPKRAPSEIAPSARGSAASSASQTTMVSTSP